MILDLASADNSCLQVANFRQNADLFHLIEEGS